MLLYLIFILSVITWTLIFYTVLSALMKNKLVISSRLSRISKQSVREADSELNKPLFIRVIQPMVEMVSRIVLRITPKEVTSGYEKKVMMAGSPMNLSVKDWISIQVILGFGIPLSILIVGWYMKLEANRYLYSVLMVAGLGFLLPNFILSKNKTKRQKEIQNTLPDVLDLLTVSVEAGLGFDGALTKVVDKMPGALASEFDNVLQEMKVGKLKRDAFKDMADRTGVPDLNSFIGAIIQADQLGVSIGNVLRLQSEQMRQKRRQRAQEKAMKAPIKMLLPMVMFIFPTIFSVLLGPVVIKILDTFMGQ